MGQVKIYSGSGENDEITAEIDSGYDVLYDKLKEDYESDDELNSDICRILESGILREIQAQSEGPELDSFIADILISMMESGNVDIDTMVQDSIHQLSQASE